MAEKIRRMKRPRDPAQLAKIIVDIATGEVEDRGPTPDEEGKDPAAVSLGRRGGLKGGRRGQPASLTQNAKRLLLKQRRLDGEGTLTLVQKKRLSLAINKPLSYSFQNRVRLHYRLTKPIPCFSIGTFTAENACAFRCQQFRQMSLKC